MKYSLVILLILTAECHAQTYADLQSKFEIEKIEAYNYQLSKIEVYSFKNHRDSALLSFEIFNTQGNIVTARQYNYKSRKYFSEQFYEYDTLGRRIKFIERSTYLDKINKARVATHLKYQYRGDSLCKIIIESYNEDKLVESREFPERKKEAIKFEKEEIDSLKRTVHFEYYSVAGLEKHDVKYHENGQGQSDEICYIDNQLWYEVRYNVFGNLIEYKEWLFDSKAHKLLEHSLTFYNDDQKIISKDYLNSKRRITKTEKYYYYRNCK